MLVLFMAVCLISGLLIGFLLGSRRSRRSRRELLKTVNATNLELLDVKTERNQLIRREGQNIRKDKLLRLSLQRLQQANSQITRLTGTVRTQERHHYILKSRLRLGIVEAREQTKRAATIAARATSHLRRLESASPVTQTITTPPPKSYGHGETVTVSVVDQHSPDVRRDAVTRVSNRDSVRLTRLQSSNEGHRNGCEDLQAIDGICPALEQTLNDAGIHRLEQLANLSDSELHALNQVVVEIHGREPSTDWKGDARQLLREHLPG